MRRDEQRLVDILEALDSVAKITLGLSESAFLADDTVRFAVAHRLTVAGEAVARLNAEIRGKYEDVPWIDVVGFRNILVHEYFGVHWPLVWQTVTEYAPELRRRISAILEAEFPPSASIGG